MAVLRRWSHVGAPWIETGTYLGATTRTLSRRTARVISLEPDTELYQSALKRLKGHSSIELINLSSEEGLTIAIQRIPSGPVNFWLDGHYSGGETHRGVRVSPILIELRAIDSLLSANRSVAVFIDDVRLFVAEHREDTFDDDRDGYPSLDSLVEWSRRHRLMWTIEHDIFIARTEDLNHAD